MDLLSQKKTDDSELPLGSESDPLDPPRLPANLSDAETVKYATDFAIFEDEVRRHRWAHALQAIGRWPEKAVDGAGHDLSLLVAYLLYKAEMEDDAIDRLKPLAADAAYLARRPSVLYYLARSLYGEAFYEAGVREMNRYLEAAPPALAAPPASPDFAR